MFSRADSEDLCGLGSEVLNCSKISGGALSLWNLESLLSSLANLT